jgi:hypothetical protein
MQNTIGQPPQSVQVPNYSGVNIQIFNPSVAAPGASLPPQNTNNNNNYYTNPCYPQSYYTQNMNPASANANATATATTTAAPAQVPAPASSPASANANATATATINAAPVAAPPVQAQEPEKKKTEKRNIVQLTDEYIKNLENYLNSQDPEVRVMGAKEVVARLQEDDSRKGDLALNALVNKMLQDPSQKVKIMAMAALNSRIATGDNVSVQLLKGIQQQSTGYGQDALDATNILLKMAGTTVQKEFEVKDQPKKEQKSEKA